MLLYNTIDAFRIYLNEPRSVDHWFKKYEWELMLIAAARLREEREAIKLELKRKAKVRKYQAELQKLLWLTLQADESEL